MEELVFLGDVRHIPYLYGIVKAYNGDVSFKRTFKFMFEDAEFEQYRETIIEEAKKELEKEEN